jgi:hypothetical protein
VDLVEAAVNELVSLVFSTDDREREAAAEALSAIGEAQPAFLKNACRVLLARYKGQNPKKGQQAGYALQEIFVGKPAAKFITDPELMAQLELDYNRRRDGAAAQQVADAATLERAQNQIDLSTVSAMTEVKNYGLAYNKAIVGEDMEGAQQALSGLVQGLFGWHAANKALFIAGNMLLALIGAPESRQPFFKNTVDYLLKLKMQGTPDQAVIASEIMETILDSVQDLLTPDMAARIRADVLRKRDEQRKRATDDEEMRRRVRGLQIDVSLGWEDSMQKLGEAYNAAVAAQNEANLRKVMQALEKNVWSNDDIIRSQAADMLNTIFGKNINIVKGIVEKLLAKHRAPAASKALGLMVDGLRKFKQELDTTDWVINEIEEDRKAREEEDRQQREARQAEYQRVSEVSIKFDGDWNEEILELVQTLNKNILEHQSQKNVKLIDKNLGNLMKAADPEVREQAQKLFANIGLKYWDTVEAKVDEWLQLFNSDNEHRYLAVDTLGRMYEAGLIEKIREKAPAVADRLPEEWSQRQVDLENEALAKKIKNIRFDVTVVRMRDEWHSKVQKLVLKYNEFIKAENPEGVFDVVKKIVDIVLNERKEEIQTNATEVLGLVAKQNIEMIAPSINYMISLLDSRDLEARYRAIYGLGEVCAQRPGWSYTGLEKLVELTVSDGDDKTRMRAMQELSKIARQGAIMLVEFLPQLIQVLANDSFKHVRLWAARTLETIADTIPQELQEVIPQLQDALHDEFLLVRKIADNTLTKIRESMR